MQIEHICLFICSERLTTHMSPQQEQNQQKQPARGDQQHVLHKLSRDTGGLLVAPPPPARQMRSPRPAGHTSFLSKVQAEWLRWLLLCGIRQTTSVLLVSLFVGLTALYGVWTAVFGGALKTTVHQNADYYASGLGELVEPSQNAFQPRYHLIFSTECSLFNEWQAFLFLHSHEKSGFLPKARITRIISCNKSNWKQEAIDYKWLQGLFPNYRELWTPNYNPFFRTGDNYAPRNRPHSLLHLFNHMGNEFVNDHEIVILMDPDQLFVSKNNDFGVSEGNPVAAEYASGTDFLNWAKDYCAGACNNVPNAEQLQIGAPYVVHARDLKKIAPLWVEVMEQLRANEVTRKKGDWLTDMYAYTIATLRLGIRHRMAPMMISHPEMDSEPWHLADAEDKKTLFVLHYCQAINLGNYHWFKHEYRDEQFNFTSCDTDKPWQFPTVTEGQLQAVDLTSSMLQLAAERLPKHRDHPIAQKERLPRGILLVNRNVWLYQNIIPLANKAFAELYSARCEK
eukprot:TRINITY_DN3984_c0_g1_i1.p1 TRINITY_DN3984_c0_g1~~TRINITY_DN3984_c0_g1_i1.p1  ORF type:complete len:510 (+),score=94.08 TRINITY_DN3984_c0_g1_i1:492-2021(+)